MHHQLSYTEIQYLLTVCLYLALSDRFLYHSVFTARYEPDLYKELVLDSVCKLLMNGKLERIWSEMVVA